MPTAKQMQDIANANLILFGGDPEVVGYGSKDEISDNDDGEVIGTIQYDPKENELNVKINLNTD